MDSPGSTADDIQNIVPALRTKAVRAYEYAVAMYEIHGQDSACTASRAVSNCIGERCDQAARGVRPYKAWHFLWQCGCATTGNIAIHESERVLLGLSGVVGHESAGKQ
jgi:hypothetical protein